MSTIPVRFVCISDTFGETPDLPAGDVLIHAGNLTKHGTLEELEQTISWLDEAQFGAKLLVAGDHDKCLDRSDLEHHVAYANHQCPPPLKNAATVRLLGHEPQIVNLKTSAGPTVRFKVFGSPFSHRRGVSAFAYDVDEAFDLWADVPLDSDVRGFAGCRSLRGALWRVRPRLAVCGREYAGRGVEVVRWELDEPFVKYREDYVYHLKGPVALHKQPRYNVSSSSRRPLRNDGSVGHYVPLYRPSRPRATEATSDNTSIEPVPTEATSTKTLFEASMSVNNTKIGAISARRKSSLALGLGGTSMSGTQSLCDQEAIVGREGRLETAFVNGAYLPCDRVSALQGSQRYNKPIVIDVDMPISVFKDGWYIQQAKKTA